MRVLLIEDDQFKQEHVERVICQSKPMAEITVERSVQHAVAALSSGPYDMIILDIALPSHGSRPGGAQPVSQLSGGIEVLLELSYDGRTDPVVILTQYPEIEFNGRLHPLDRAKKALLKEIRVNIVDILNINSRSNVWRDRLMKALA
jgi:DNA-binding NarL/FixJ family response regulator